MKILFVTRPIAPPWNEGSKNTVMALAGNMKEEEIHLLTANGFKAKENHIISEPIFSKSGLVTGRSLKQKLRLLKRLFRRDDIQICHFFFKPTPLVALAARIAMLFSGKKTVQTIVSMPEEGELLKQSIFSKNLVAGSGLMQKFLKKEG